MQELIILKNSTEQGIPLEATFAPLKGMNLLSFKKGSLETLDQSTKGLFLERSAGLGALIGPHFHHRKPEIIPPLPDLSLFPHLAKSKAQEIVEPFSHGIARYVPWKYAHSETQLHATLSGKDHYRGIPIKDLEGQDFEMRLDAKLVHDGLCLHLSIQSEIPSVVGFHYYYHYLPESYVQAFVHPHYRGEKGWEPLPCSWYDSLKHKLHFDLSQNADFGFKPLAQPDHPYHLISVKNPSSPHVLHVEYTASYEEETSWQLYHPQGASFVCIEPLSALNPRNPILNISNLQLKISVF